MSFISRGRIIHHTGTVPLCSTSGSTSRMDRTSMARTLFGRLGQVVPEDVHLLPLRDGWHVARRRRVLRPLHELHAVDVARAVGEDPLDGDAHDGLGPF